MKKKVVESRWRKVVKDLGWYWHKYGDVRYCMHCHKPLPKSENAPDFAVAPVFTYVECKQSDSTGRWNWKEIAEDGTRANQRKWLLDNHGWLFIELGTGNAPNGRQAYLVPIIIWVYEVEPKLIELKMSSIRKETRGKRPGADDLLSDYTMEWESGEGWRIPPNHQWWKSLLSKLQQMNKEVMMEVTRVTDG